MAPQQPKPAPFTHPFSWKECATRSLFSLSTKADSEETKLLTPRPDFSCSKTEEAPFSSKRMQQPAAGCGGEKVNRLGVTEAALGGV